MTVVRLGGDEVDVDPATSERMAKDPPVVHYVQDVRHYTGCLCPECAPHGVGHVAGFGSFPIPAPSVFEGDDCVTDESNPPPTPTDHRPTWELVVEDMQRRDHVGRARYGTPLQPDNGRDSLVDAYEEALDLCVYLKNEILKRGAR